MVAPRWLKLFTCSVVACWLPLAAQAGEQTVVVPLQCRLSASPWRSCQMVVEQLGRHWYLELDGQRLEFRHNGDGRIRMRRDAAGWQEVDSHWEDESLCWGQVCAKGEIPLD